MAKNTFVATAKSIYNKISRPLAFLLVFAAFVLRFTPWPEVAVGVLVALGFIVLPVVFEIHTMLSEKVTDASFASFNDAIPHIQLALDDYIRRTPNPQIQVLGFALVYQWPMLYSYLSQILNRAEPRPLAIRIALLDPDWTDTAALNRDFPGTASNHISATKAFVLRHRKQIHQYGWSISLFTFRYTPHWFGILIGDDVLFLGRGDWNNGVLMGGSNRVERITARGSIMESEKIDEFRQWFQQCQQKQSDIGLDAEA